MKLQRWQAWSLALCAGLALSLLTVSNTLQAAAHDEDEHATDESHGHDEHADHDQNHDDTADHAAHAPHDNSHGNASPNLDKAEEFKKDIAIYTLVVFILMVVLLRIVAWKPIIAGLDAREQKIIGAIEDARKSADEAQQRLEEYEARLAAAAQEANEIVAEGRRDAEATKDRIVAEAAEAAKAEQARAINEIELAKNAALQAVAEQSTDIAVALAGKIVGRQLNPEDHSKLVQESLDSLSEN
ncbi:MAG: F0F1 ATP synthase subunit B [Planctomycetaceae bacterium]|nr:F0F1 ATP synthase subunit B [Planctomycetaceae bacterium]